MLSCYLRRSAQVFAFSIWQPWQAIGHLTFGRGRRHMGSKTTSSSRRIGRRWSGPNIGVRRRALSGPSGPSSLNEVASPDGQFDFAVSATLAAAAGGLGLCPTPLSPPKKWKSRYGTWANYQGMVPQQEARGPGAYDRVAPPQPKDRLAACACLLCIMRAVDHITFNTCCRVSAPGLQQLGLNVFSCAYTCRGTLVNQPMLNC